MIIHKNKTTFFISPDRSKETPYLFEGLSNDDPDFLKLLFGAYLFYFFQNFEILEDLHKKMEERSPQFYNRLAEVFLSKIIMKETGDISDFFRPFLLVEERVSIHRQIFLAHLLTAKKDDLRETGIKLIKYCSLMDLSAVINYCKRIHNKFPRSARTAIKKYLKNLEIDEEKFDLNLMYNKNKLRSIYSSLHIKPSERADNILFKNITPENSLAQGIKILRVSFDSDILYSTIKKYKIPIYSAIKNINFFSYQIAEKIISNITPEELSICYPLLKQKGITKNEDLRLAINEKIKHIQMKQTTKPIRRILGKPNKNKEKLYNKLHDLLESIRGKNLKITKPTALFIDKSGSMYDYLEIAKAFVYLLGNLANKDNFFIYLFNKKAKELKPHENKNWLSEFDSLETDEGGSCIGDALQQMEQKGQIVENVCIISDGNENLSPSYVTAYKKYMKSMKIAPFTILIKTGYFSYNFEQNIKYGGMPCMITEFTDYEETLEEIFPLMCTPPIENIIENVLNYKSETSRLRLPEAFNLKNNS